MQPPSSFDDTLKLVARAQDDDQEALQTLFARYLPRVRRIAALRLGHRSQALYDVDDIVQEALVDAFRGLSGFDIGSEGQFCNWLARIVENRVRMVFRSESAAKRGGTTARRSPDGVTDLIDPAPSPTWHARRAEADERIEQELLAMPNRYREILIHRTFCRIPYADIAAEMGLATENSARSLHSKAVRELAARLQVDPGSGAGASAGDVSG